MLDSLLATCFQNVQKACEVAIGIAVRVADGIADTGLRGQVDNTVSTAFCKYLQKLFTVKDVHFVKRESLVCSQQRQTVVFEPNIIIGVHAVNADHLLPTDKQCLAYVKPDESRCASDYDM